MLRSPSWQLTCLCVCCHLYCHVLQADPGSIPGDAGITASPGVVVQLTTTATHTFTIRANGEGTSKEVSVSIGFRNAATAGLQDATVYGSDGSKGERVQKYLKIVCNGTGVDPSLVAGAGTKLRCVQAALLASWHPC